MRSPGQELENSFRHIRHLRAFTSYTLSLCGFLFCDESLISTLRLLVKTVPKGPLLMVGFHAVT